MVCFRASSITPDYQLTSCDYTSKIVGIGAVSSAFLYQSSPCITSYLDDDYAPILVLIEYLCALEVMFSCYFTPAEWDCFRLNFDFIFDWTYNSLSIN